MKLIVMTRPTCFVEEDKILSSLFNAGLDRLHLYKPGNEPMFSERLLTLLPEEHHEDIVVHENYYLREEFGLRGIHYDNPDAAPERLKGKVSCTCRDMERLKDLRKRFDYVFLRNIFDSQCEPEERQTFTKEQLEEAADRGLIGKNVYALGGMNEETVRRAKEYGFGGVVICGDLWNRFHVHTEQDYRALIAHFERLKKIVD